MRELDSEDSDLRHSGDYGLCKRDASESGETGGAVIAPLAPVSPSPPHAVTSRGLKGRKSIP